MQVIVDAALPNYTDLVEKLGTGASVSATGKVVESPGGKQKVELHATQLELIGSCDQNSIPCKKRDIL